MEAIFEIFYYCGLRCGELRGLKWTDIDLEHRTLSVRQPITDRCGSIKKYKFVVPKTQNSIRTLKMPKVLTEDLKKAKLEAKQMSGFNENYFVAADVWPISSNALTERKIIIVIDLELNKLDFTILDIHVHLYLLMKEQIFKSLLDI